jgi:thiol-disulfide isomerase/thioredoxin
MRQIIHAIATALSFFKVKAKVYSQKFYNLLRKSILINFEQLCTYHLREFFVAKSLKKKCGMLYPFRYLPVSSCLSLVLVFITIHQGIGQVKPLLVGEQLPQIELSNILGNDGQIIDTKNLRGKVLILDFWSTYCGSCIANMPNMISLQERMKDSLLILPVNSETKERIQKVWNTNPNLKKLPIFTVYEDDQLKNLFPHELFPHLVWIDREGKYLGATLVEYANPENVRTIWEGQRPKWAVKKDEDLFDPKLASLHTYLNMDTAQHFLPYINGVGSQSRILTEADSTIRYFAVNTRMSSQYGIATYFEGLAYEPKRRVIAIKDVNAYEYQKSYGYVADWEQKYAYSYERVFPKGTTQKQIHYQLMKDLNTHFGLEGKIESLPTDVLELRMVDANVVDTDKSINGMKLKNWLAAINTFDGFPWIVKSENLDLTSQMPPIKKGATLKEIQQTLLPYGLRLVPAKVNLPTFHLTTKPKS